MIVALPSPLNTPKLDIRFFQTDENDSILFDSSVSAGAANCLRGRAAGQSVAIAGGAECASRRCAEQDSSEFA